MKNTIVQAKEPLVNRETGETHWYYTGATCTHGSALQDRHKCIGRATWRNEGFISLDIGGDTGSAADVGGSTISSSRVESVETVVLELPAAAAAAGAGGGGRGSSGASRRNPTACVLY
eukprot:COSAG06_NODE_2102_length_7592_cov_14.509676_4_plen_118_part_00